MRYFTLSIYAMDSFVGFEGIGYRCIVCADYDLCQVCMSSHHNPHLEHDFLEIPSRQWVSKNVHTCSVRDFGGDGGIGLPPPRKTHGLYNREKPIVSMGET